MSDITKLKKQIEREGLVSLMNDTRWRQLIDDLLAAKLFPKFRVKVVGESQPAADWELSFPHHLPQQYLCIEWLELSAAFSHRRGKLVPDEIIDRSEELEQILRQTRVPFTMQDNVYRVWGHVSPGLSPQFVVREL